MANSKPLIVNNGTTEQFPATPGDTLEVAGNLDVTSGQVAIPDGTAAAPAIAFRDDLNNGIFSPGTDQLAISTAGTQRMVVDATGQVGIGTTAPSRKLEVAGDIRAASSTSTEINSVTTDTNSYGQIAGVAPGNVFWTMRANGSGVAATFMGTPDGNWNTWQAGAGGNGLKVGVNASGQQFLLGSYEPGTITSAVRLTLNDDEAIFNAPGHDFDFRVESVANANMLLVDASQNSVSVGTSGNTHTFNVGTGSSANFCVASGGRIHTYDGTAPTNGQVLIGDTASGNFAKAAITAGTGIAITNGAGSITIAASNAGGVQPITTISSNTTLGGANYTVLCNGGLTVSLPAAASNTGRVYNIKKIDAGGLGLDTIIDPNGAETIDGAATYTLTTQYESVTIQCNGTAWFIL